MSYKIGLDLGIASVGWSVLETDHEGNPVKIIDLGTRIFDKAENPKDGSSLAATRREARGMRRRLRRRKHRIERTKKLLESQGICTYKEIEDMYNGYRFQSNVYENRVDGLDNKLTDRELTRVLISFVKRRGYKSNSKSEETKDTESGKLLKAIQENNERMKEKKYRTVAEMYLKEELFSNTWSNGEKVVKIRNTNDDYKATVLRSDLLKEIQLILNKQKEFNSKVTDEFIERYISIFSSQRDFDEGPAYPSKYGGSQIENMLGRCTFEKSEYRSVKASYTFEYFKLLQDINHIKIYDFKDSRSLDEKQRNILIEYSKEKGEMTYLDIRKKLNIDNSYLFNTVNYNKQSIKNNKKAENEEELLRACEKNTKFNQFQSYHKIRKALDKNEKGCISKFSVEDLDKIGYALSVYKNDNKRSEYLKNNIEGISEEVINMLLPLNFSKTGNLSIKAMKKIIPYLETGITYDKAVDSVENYNFRGNINTQKRRKLSLNDVEESIENPVVRRSVSQTIKVINAITLKYEEKYGNPIAVNIELARELAKNFNDRKKINNRNEENRAKNERIKDRIEKEFGKQNVTGQDIVKWKLWEEQDGICPYSGKRIEIQDIFTEVVDVDHIIPYSISFDDSYSNKVLVLASENRQKGNRVPLQYIREERQEEDRYVVRVQNMFRNIKKKQKLLRERVTREDIDGFKERNLKDTQYLSRYVHNLLVNNLKFEDNKSSERKVYVINGSITSHVRKRLGIEKIRSNGDEHHAIDAVVIASVSQKMINDISKYYKYNEVKFTYENNNFIDTETGEILSREDMDKEYGRFPEPWSGFRKELDIRLMQNKDLMHRALKDSDLVRYENIDSVKPIFVSRMPRRKVTGPAHKETIRGLRYVDDKPMSVVKTPLTKLKLTKDRMDIEGYSEKQKQDDIYLYKGLVKRLQEFDGNAENAFKEPFYKPNKDGSTGALVKKVKIQDKTTLFVPLNNNKSLADNGSMVRIDVFRVENEGYYLIPIYVSDTKKKELPNKASVAHKPYSKWKEMNDKNFIFSLYPNDLVKITSKKEICQENHSKEVMGYYTGTDIANANISIITHNNSRYIEGIGLKTLPELKKYQVDMLGKISEVRIPEKRLGFNMKEGRKA